MSQKEKTEKTKEQSKNTETKQRAEEILSLCKRRGFIWPAFEIYGSSAGFYDYGPLGASLKKNILEIWRRHYVIGEGFAEIDSPNISPEMVFIASGHVDHFSDYLIQCTACTESFKLNTVLKEYHDSPDTLSLAEMKDVMKKNSVTCPLCGGALGEPESFNLMFKTYIGPTRDKVAYLRPETAQGIFINFSTLYRYAREKFPFGVVQIGKGFRNEISPRQGLLRLREFNMAEAEVFVDPENKTWERFKDVKNDTIRFLPRDGKEKIMTAETAVKKGTVANEALAYFIALTNRFLQEIGVDKERLRFRQHLKDEMAHYAIDCWDAEALLSYGWIEIVGIADRGCYDLSRHNQYSNQPLTAFKKFETAKERERKKIKPNVKKIGPKFGKETTKIVEALAALGDGDVEKAEKNGVTLDIDGKKITITKEFYDVVTVNEKISGVAFTPHVIEPSYGIDRIIYTVLEHAYHATEKEGEAYMILKLMPAVAPIPIGVFPLMAKDGLDDIAQKIDLQLRTARFITAYDDVGSIGRRYARADEIGVPFCVTVDYQTKEDKTVTVRSRDTTEQRRMPIEALLDFFKKELA